MKFVIITGLSGAGKTQAIRCFEDLGFFCVDNLPPTLIPKFADLCRQLEGKIQNIALVIDIRGVQFFGQLFEVLKDLKQMGYKYEILFLEASDNVLIRRFKESRRRHPLAPQGRILEGIKIERARLWELREHADHIIDTSNLTPHDLKEQITVKYSFDPEQTKMIITIMSFGFKHGIPLDADMVFDVRFMNNPHYVENLRPLSGNNQLIRDYVLSSPVVKEYLHKLKDLIEFSLPYYIKEGKSNLVIAIGCTGGRHRSVVIANELADFLREKEYKINLEHRDIRKGMNGVEKYE
ncbi:MAG TPA: RNase adapter RapZ [Clostridia bacterium]|nr:RNase adapter RapZ [Clostridia bacterium]